MNVTFEIVKNSPEIRTYITQADASLTALGFTEHSCPHPACNCRAGAVFCHCSVTRLSITSSIVYDYPLHSTQKKHPL